MGAVARRPGPSLRPCCFAVSDAPFVSCGGWKTAIDFLVGSESDARQWGPLPEARSVPQGPAVSLFRMRRLWASAAGRQLDFLVGSESDVRQWGPLPEARSVPQGPAVSLFRMRRLWASAAGRQLDFLVGSESDVRQWGPLPGGPVRPSGPCCFAVSDAPFVSCGGWKTARFSCRVRKWR